MSEILVADRLEDREDTEEKKKKDSTDELIPPEAAFERDAAGWTALGRCGLKACQVEYGECPHITDY